MTKITSQASLGGHVGATARHGGGAFGANDADGAGSDLLVVATPEIRDCARHNAMAVMRVPAEFANPVTCLMHGQAYLAQTSLGEELDGNDRVKVVCARIETVDASIRTLTVR